jgi:hypothetical protein
MYRTLSSQEGTDTSGLPHFPNDHSTREYARINAMNFSDLILEIVTTLKDPNGQYYYYLRDKDNVSWYHDLPSILDPQTIVHGAALKIAMIVHRGSLQGRWGK